METDIEFAIQELERLQFLLEYYRDPTSASADNSNNNNTNNNNHSENGNGSNRKGSKGDFPTDLSRSLTIQATIDPTYPSVGFQTTFGRELWFCSLHAVRNKRDHYLFFLLSETE